MDVYRSREQYPKKLNLDGRMERGFWFLECLALILVLLVALLFLFLPFFLP